jgi:diguanylate cyclase (GGDEF)-like protein
VNPSALIPLIATVVYVSLSIILVLNRPWRQRHRLFLLFLVPALLWSLITFLSLQGWFTQNRQFDVSLVVCVAMLTLIQFHYLVRSFYRSEPVRVPLVYLFLAATIILVAVGPIREILGPNINKSGLQFYGFGIFGIYVLFGSAVGTTDVLSWIRKYRLSPDPAERNQMFYMLLSIVIFTVFFALGAPGGEIPWSHIGNLAVACILTYAVITHRLLDIRVVLRQFLVYLVLYGGGIGIPSLLLVLLYNLDKHTIDAGPLAMIVALYITAIVLLSGHKVRDLLQRKVERAFVGAKSFYRRQLSEFIAGIHDVSTFEQLGRRFLPLLAQSVDCRRACLLLPEAGEGDFSAQFTYPPVDGNPMGELRLRKDNPIVAWLEQKGTILQERSLAIVAEFQSIWEEERMEIRSAGVEMFVPILNEGKLVAIVAVSDKRDGKSYTVEDTDLLEFIGAQVAAGMVKEYSHERERQRSRTDELTGLFNRRCFAERLKEELDRHSRYNDMFSIFMIDLDNFKAYNDAHGHLAGDILLGHIGRIIKSSVRHIDQAFRYGGDEFVVLLPHTARDSAYEAADRVRKKVAEETEKKATAVTCSIGLASYPVDGVLSDELVGVADTALYHAKRTGGNRIFLASKTLSKSTEGTGISGTDGKT